MAINPYVINLREMLDPRLEGVSVDRMPSSDPILSMLGREPVPATQVSKTGEVTIYGYRGKPGVWIGDSIKYEDKSQRKIESGVFKMKRITQQVILKEEDLERIETNQGEALNLLQREVEYQLKRNNEYYIKMMQKMALYPSDIFTDGNFHDLFATSSTGTLTAPADLNETAGTAQDLSTSVKIDGSNKTLNNAYRLTKSILKRFYLRDDDEDFDIRWNAKQLYIGIHPKVKIYFDTTHDKRNATSEVETSETITQLLEGMGFTFIESVYFDDDFDDSSDDATSTLVVFAEPKDYFKIGFVEVMRGKDSWSDWKDRERVDGGETVIEYTKKKRAEFGPLNISINVNNTWYKPVAHFTITVIDDVD